MRVGLRPQKILVASGARVAPGGEKGPFQWLVPALVVIVVLFAALTVRSEADPSSRASTSAPRPHALAAAAPGGGGAGAGGRAGGGAPPPPPPRDEGGAGGGRPPRPLKGGARAARAQ